MLSSLNKLKLEALLLTSYNYILLHIPNFR
nr:MAG TPA: hypothetical protein [Caudoviricetes sp.]